MTDEHQALIRGAAWGALGPWADTEENDWSDAAADQVRDAVVTDLADNGLMIVQVSFVESVLYSGAFHGEDLDKLYAEAARLIDAADPAYLQGAHSDEIKAEQSGRLGAESP